MNNRNDEPGHRSYGRDVLIPCLCGWRDEMTRNGSAIRLSQQLGVCPTRCIRLLQRGQVSHLLLAWGLWCATTEYAGSIELCATVVVVFKGALRPTKLDACSGGLVRTSTGAGTVPDWIWTKSAFARIVIKPAARHADKSSGSYTDILAAVAVLLATPTEPHTPKLGAMPIESRPTRRPTNAPPSI
jgi:hypothetical protein